MNPIRVMLVEDSLFVRQLVKVCVDRSEDMKVVAEASDPFEADADTEYREKRDAERQRVIDELKRRNFEGQYDV